MHGYVYLPVGICLSSMGWAASYDQAIVWNVIMTKTMLVFCIRHPMVLVWLNT